MITGARATFGAARRRKGAELPRIRWQAAFRRARSLKEVQLWCYRHAKPLSLSLFLSVPSFLPSFSLSGTVRSSFFLLSTTKISVEQERKEKRTRTELGLFLRGNWQVTGRRGKRAHLFLKKIKRRKIDNFPFGVGYLAANGVPLYQWETIINILVWLDFACGVHMTVVAVFLYGFAPGVGKFKGQF